MQLWSMAGADANPVEGGQFSLYNGDIQGRYLRLIPHQIMIQEWFANAQDEPSIATVRIEQQAAKSRIRVEHIGVPINLYEGIKTGWQDYILNGIKHFLETQPTS